MPCTYIWRYLPHDCLPKQEEHCKQKCAAAGKKYCCCLVIAEVQVDCVDWTGLSRWGTKVDFFWCFCKKERHETEEIAEKRKKFKKHKKELREEWEKENGTPWPTDDDGTPYDAHHLDPIEYCGENASRNLVPVRKGDHPRITKAINDCLAKC